MSNKQWAPGDLRGVSQEGAPGLLSVRGLAGALWNTAPPGPRRVLEPASVLLLSSQPAAALPTAEIWRWP